MVKPSGNEKLDVLKRIYALFESTMAPFDNACQKKCAACCTCNVTMTRLEAQLMLDTLSAKEIDQLSERIVGNLPQKRYQPELTTNIFARYVIQNKDIPEEDNDPSWGKCPLVIENECSIYDVRPFGCRALMSQVSCQENGYAQMPPLVLTINNIFQQAIEHLDHEGIFGNLCDVLYHCLLSENSGPRGARQSGLSLSAGQPLLKNEKITVLMVPGEHRKRVEKLVQELSGLIG